MDSNSQQLLLTTMAVFTGVAAVALIIQMAFLFGIYRAVKALQERSSAFMDRWEPVADSSMKTLEQLREQTSEILRKISELTDSTKAQIDKVDSILSDVSEFSKTQLGRVDHTVEGHPAEIERDERGLAAYAAYPGPASPRDGIGLECDRREPVRPPPPDGRPGYHGRRDVHLAGGPG